jgi:hypothetical protein
VGNALPLSKTKAQGSQPMNPNISFETALQLLTMAYAASVMLLLTASNVGLAVIEIIEEADD